MDTEPGRPAVEQGAAEEARDVGEWPEPTNEVLRSISPTPTWSASIDRGT